MKTKKITFTAILLMITLMAGCASFAAPQESESAANSIPTETLTRDTIAGSEAVGAATEATEATEGTNGETEFVVAIKPVITESQNQVIVKTADEFIAAIAPNTEIIVDAELIDFSKAKDYGTGSGEYYRWVEALAGPELYITGVSNLTIRGSGEVHNANVLSAVPRYANVLNFANCSNIYVKGLTVGHTEEPGYCMGGVLCFMNSQDILVEDCGLFGCGTLGVVAYSSKNMQIVNNDIYECSIGGVEFTNCDDVNVDGNTFRDLGGPEFRVYGCGVITCNGEAVRDFNPRQ